MHKTDTVSVIVACTINPIPIDLLGIIKLSSSLTRIEDRLQSLVSDYSNASFHSDSGGENKQQQQYLSLKFNSKIPSCSKLTVKMWHFGQDALTSYSGEKFDVSWEDSLKIFHICSKQYENSRKIKIRKEIQECPDKPLEDAIMDKIKTII